MTRRLQETFRWVTDKGTDFRYADLTGWWRDPSLLTGLGHALVGLFPHAQPTVVIAPASRGLILGALAAQTLAVGLVEARRDNTPAADSDAWLQRAKVHTELVWRGQPMAHCSVERLMHAAGLRGVSRAKGPRTTIPGTGPETRADLVAREFSAPSPDRLWVADITYCKTPWIPAIVATLDVRSSDAGDEVDRGAASGVDGAHRPMRVGASRSSGHRCAPRRGLQVDEGGFSWSSQHLDDGGVDEHTRPTRGGQIRAVVDLSREPGAFRQLFQASARWAPCSRVKEVAEAWLLMAATDAGSG